MDFDPTPEECEGLIWNLGISSDEDWDIEDAYSIDIEWGSWVDSEGNNQADPQ